VEVDRGGEVMVEDGGREEALFSFTRDLASLAGVGLLVGTALDRISSSLIGVLTSTRMSIVGIPFVSSLSSIIAPS